MKRSSRLAWLILACLLLVAVFVPSASAQVRETGMWWLPPVVTKGGEKIDFIFYIIFWLTFVVFVGYGLFAASIRNHVISRPKVLVWMRRTFAGAFALLGAKLAFADR